MDAQAFAAVAAGASASGALLAAFATWYAPSRAAHLAEKLRSEADKRLVLKNERERIFYQLMQARGGATNREIVAAFNLIDLVYSDVLEVRDAWAELFAVYNSYDSHPPALAREKLSVLLKSMAFHLQYSNTLRSADLERYYYPIALQTEDSVKFASQRNLLTQLEQTSRGAGESSLFPPPP